MPQEAEIEQFYEDLQDFLKLTPKNNPFFITGDWNAKVGNQETPAVTGKFGLGVEQRLIEFCQENTLIIVNTLFQQYQRRLYTWTSPDNQHRNQIDYIPCSQRWRSSIQSAKTRLEADCGSDQRSDQISRLVVSDSLRPHESQHARPPCPSPTPGVHSDSHPLSQ